MAGQYFRWYAVANLSPAIKPAGFLHRRILRKELVNNMDTVPKSKRIPPIATRSRKGVPNKVNGDIKNMILEALSNAGGAEYLTRKANDPKTAAAFLGLIGKVLPMTLAGDPNSPLMVVTRIELISLDDSTDKAT